MEGTNLGLSNDEKDKEDFNEINTNQSDLTVKQLIKLFNPSKQIFIKPCGNGMYYEGTVDELPDYLNNLKVLEMVPKIYYDKEFFNPYYTKIGLWVDRTVWLDERIKKYGIIQSGNNIDSIDIIKKKNLVISGVPGSGKTRECKQRITELLEDNNNRIVIYCVEHDYDDFEKFTYGVTIKKQEDGENIFEFFAWVYNNFMDNYLEHYNYTVFIDCDCFPHDDINIIEFTNWIRKLNKFGISVCFVVNDYEEIFCGADKEKFNKFIIWLSENFTEFNIKR